jgi:poly(3-hydroxybutyrate) depolymerase
MHIKKITDNLFYIPFLIILLVAALSPTYHFLDKDHVNVWGWSGGGSMTQNLLFRYPEIYQTGVAGA